MKRTIIVVFTDKPRDVNEILDEEKRYTFNISEDSLEDIEEGDVLSTPFYNRYFQVTRVMDEVYTYFNKETGELSNYYKSIYQYPIKTLFLSKNNVLPAYKVNFNQDFLKTEKREIPKVPKEKRAPLYEGKNPKNK